MCPYIPFLALLALSTVGCQSVKRIVDGPAAPAPQAPLIVRGGQLGPMPTFNVPTPAGTTLVVIHQFVPSNGVITGLESSQMRVFLLDEVSHQWFVLGTSYSGAWYYTYASGAITVHGNTLSQKEICIYEYVQGE